VNSSLALRLTRVFRGALNHKRILYVEWILVARLDAPRVDLVASEEVSVNIIL